MMMKKTVLGAVLALLSGLGLAKVNINTASIEELTALKGIGEGKAQAIVEYREANGAFASVDDLVNVKGIGDKILEGIRDEITVDGEAGKGAATKAQGKEAASGKAGADKDKAGKAEDAVSETQAVEDKKKPAKEKEKKS